MHAETKAILETNLASVMRRIADAQREAEELQPVADELRAMLNGAHVMQVKVDGMECMRKVLAPGAILLSAGAVTKLYSALDECRTMADLTALLAECGGIASTAEPEAKARPFVPYLHVWIDKTQVPQHVMELQAGDFPLVWDGRDVAVPWAELGESHRAGRAPIQATT